MNDLKFDTEEYEFGTPAQEKPGFDLAGKLITWGIVSDRRQAEYVLLFFAIAIVIVSYLIYRSFTGGAEAPPLLPQ